MDSFKDDNTTLVDRLNADKARLLLPATVYIAVLMVSGLVGNTLVVIFYGVKAKRTPSSVFIVTLAVYDLVVCAICMPTEIVDIENFYTFTNGPACKLLRFLNYFAGLGSILTLIAIAADRYKKLCMPMGDQITLRKVRYITAAIAFVAVLLSWPSIAIYGSIRVNVPNSYGVQLYGHDCTSTKSQEYRSYVWAFNIVHFALFIGCSVQLIVIYSIIGKSLYRHARRLSKYRVQAPPGSCEETGSTGMTDRESNNGNHVTVGSNSSPAKETPSPAVDSDTIRLTLIMIAVTVLFIASFLPYLSLTVWRVYKGKHEAEFLSDAGLIGFKIGSRSFLLNSSVKPWIYGMGNRAFRSFFTRLVCCTRSNKT